MKLRVSMAVAVIASTIASFGSASAQQSADVDATARELANPNNSLASLTFKNQYRWYDGDLPGADDESNYTLLFQPVFPFELGENKGGGKQVFFARPAIPIVFDQPYTGNDGLGDIGFDIAYGVTEKSGFLWGVGMTGTLPTATNETLGGNFALGPEIILAKMNPWGIYGVFPTHQWSIDDWSDNEVDKSTIQPIIQFLPGGGWTFGSKGIMEYDWEMKEWTIPLQGFVGKTISIGSLPVKLELEANYYVDRPDIFGPKWMIGLNITPVVPNIIAELF